MAAVPRIPKPPWFDDGRPDLWVTVGRFARLMNRTEPTIYNWLKNGTLAEFQYPVFRDFTGRTFIRIRVEDAAALVRIEHP